MKLIVKPYNQIVIEGVSRVSMVKTGVQRIATAQTTGGKVEIRLKGMEDLELTI